MEERLATKWRKTKPFLINGFQLAIGLGQTWFMGSEELETQLVVQALTNLGIRLARKLLNSRKENASRGEETEVITPR